jgi:hypothetical protein
MMTNFDAAKRDLERFREYRRLARSEGDREMRAELLTKAREYLRRAARADPVFVACASAEAAALLARTARMRRASVEASVAASKGARIIRPDIAAWRRS